MSNHGHDRNIAANSAAVQDDRTAALGDYPAGAAVLVRDSWQTGRERPAIRGTVIGVYEWCCGIRCVDVRMGTTTRRVVAERVRLAGGAA